LESEKLKAQKGNIQFFWITILIGMPIFFLIYRVLNFNGLYGQDAHEYYRYSLALANFLTGGPEPGAFFWPVIYPAAGALLSIVFPDILSLQILSLLSGAWTYINFCRILNLMYPKGTMRQRYTFLYLFCSPFFIRAFSIGMSDILAMAFLTASWLKYLEWNSRKEMHLLLISICFGLFAVQTRYVSIILLIPIIPGILTTIKERTTNSLIILFGIIIAITPSIIFRSIDIESIISHPWISTWNPLNIFNCKFETLEGTFNYTFPNIAYVLAVIFHPGFMFTGIILVLYNLKNNFLKFKWWVITLIIYLIFLAGIPFQNLRFLLLGFPIVLILFYQGYEDMMRKVIFKRYKIILFISFILIQFVLAIRAIEPLYIYQQEEIAISNEIKKYPNSTIYCFGINGALKTYDVTQDVINLWNVSNPLLPSGALFLYNQVRFEKQYKITPPGKIYQKMRGQGRLMYIKTLPNGWQLYRIR
jgi:hypothetical protein